MREVHIRAVVVATLMVTAGCEPSAPDIDRLAATRDTLANGAIRVRYAFLPDSATTRVIEELRIGSLDGDPSLTFGDVRGIEAASDGTIYVLDYQASEIRSFTPDGRFIERIATRGEGPGEITEANGFLLHGDTLLWVQDHGKWQMLGLDRTGEERLRVAMPALRYGYIWDGTVDARGRVWKSTGHSDEVWRPFPPELGFSEVSWRSYLIRFDPATESRDSVYLGEEGYRTHVSRTSTGGYAHQGVPFAPSTISVVDPDGSIWITGSGSYEIARLNEVGDTVLVIEADAAGPEVTPRDRADFIDRAVEEDETGRRAAEELAAEMPATKPAISGMLVDDLGRLWVRRGGTETDLPRYDVFSRDGTHEESIELTFTPSQYLALRVRGGKVYALVIDDLGVPFVVRAGFAN